MARPQREQDDGAEQCVDLLRTQSDHRMLPADRLDALTTEIGQLIRDDGGIYRHRYVARLWAVQCT